MKPNLSSINRQLVPPGRVVAHGVVEPSHHSECYGKTGVFVKLHALGTLMSTGTLTSQN